MALYPDRRGSNRGGTGPYADAGAPDGGTSEVQTVTVTGSPTGGTFRLKFKGRATATIAYDAASATVQTALRALPTIGSGGCSVSGSAGGPYSVTFTGALGKRAQPLIELHANALTGGSSPTVTIVEATPGVDATGIGASKGAIYQDTDNGVLYINAGTADAPNWTSLGELDTTAILALTGGDSSLDIAGKAGSSGAGGAVAVAGGDGDSAAGGAVSLTGGAGNGAFAGGAASVAGGAGGAAGTGGAASLTGGAPASGNAAGGAASVTAGAGSGTGAGGAVALAGGASGAGATGNGGAISATGGAAASTNGSGGAASVVGGVATGTGTGGAVTLTGGASAGASGTAGSVSINPGAANSGTPGAINIGNTNACDIIIGSSSVLKLGQTAKTTEGYIWYDAAAHVLKYRDNSGTKTVTAS